MQIKYKKNGNIIYCNKSILSTLKYPLGKKPKSVFDLIPDEEVSNHYRYLKSDYEIQSPENQLIELKKFY